MGVIFYPLSRFTTILMKYRCNYFIITYRLVWSKMVPVYTMQLCTEYAMESIMYNFGGVIILKSLLFVLTTW